jgi:uncharacterized protein YqeY
MLEQIERDLKTALLGGDKVTVETLKTVKSALQYEAVNKSAKISDLKDDQIQVVLAREAKKRQEAADIYSNAGETDRAEKELTEKAVIDKYLPEQIDEADLLTIVNEEIAKLDSPTPKDMGRVIGAVKARTAGAADGALIAKTAKESLEKL